MLMEPTKNTHAYEILVWYDVHRRAMPWRALPGELSDPYRIWLSEVMLQQTTVAAVRPYFTKFIRRWPNVDALAGANLDDVLHCWQGLGYYARARSLLKCAKTLVEHYGGKFPKSEEMLLTLPGIGPYTAAAICAIAFDMRAVVVDGNVERVMARLFRVKVPLPGVKPMLRAFAGQLTPSNRCGDYCQAVMDLGATICLPSRPKCMLCPWVKRCRGRDIAEKLPKRPPKLKKPIRRGFVFWIECPNGMVLLRRRPESGLLGGMIEFPTTAWHEDASIQDSYQATGQAPIDVTDWASTKKRIHHTFTHFRLELEVLKGRAGSKVILPEGVFWCAVGNFKNYAFPTVMKKVVKSALGH